MQKKIIALAIAGLASTAAFAQTNVTVYGVVDVGYAHVSSSEANLKSKTSMDDGMQSGSRIGFRGTEDLGNGLKAVFVLESGITNDVAGQGIWSGNNRQSFLALAGNFGTVAFGRQYTPQFGLVARMDPFGVGTVGDAGSNARGLWGVVNRLDNLGAYVSPSFGGFNVIAGYTIDGFGEENATAKGARSQNTKVWAINPNYKNGGLDVGLNYHRATTKNDVDLAGNGLATSLRTYDLGASYDFGVVKPSIMYGRDKIDTGGATVVKTKKWLLGASIPVTANAAVLVSYARFKEDQANLKASKWSLGGTYNLSKRTNLYAAYAKISQNNNLDGTGTFSLDGIAGNEYLSGFNVGIRHSF